MTVNILGTEYTIEFRKKEDDQNLSTCDGYIDSSMHLIVIEDMHQEPGTKIDLEAYKKQVMRHEIIHAFMFESGLDSNSYYNGAWAINEEMIDWFAIQFHKIYKAFEQAGCI